MKISYNWLKDYIDINLPPEKLAELLTMAGLTVDSITTSGQDHILEIEVTANRPDWLSYIGVARELAAITGAKLKLPKEAKFSTGTTKKISGVKVQVADKKLCPRYTARIIRNVKIGDSPAWLKAKLESMGLKSVNNVVDITNFCLFETGEPMHAFDLDKIDGGSIIVRNAQKGEKIKTLDGIERTLDGNDLVIADKSRPIAIAGVMGGLNTEVTYSTQNILLEAAYFDPISIRRTSRKLGLGSDSSYRFERKVDIENIEKASDRAAQLIADVAGAKVCELIDISVKRTAAKPVTLRFSRLNAVLGSNIPPLTAKKILIALGMKVKPLSKDAVKVLAPAFRYDVKSEIDVIEEVSRVCGYDKIPCTIPAVVEQPIRQTQEAIIEKSIRRTLTALGFDEIISYSLLSKRAVASSGADEASSVEIKNPLSIEQEMMRPNLVPGMQQVILWNINRKSKDLKLFELGNIYTKDGNNFKEEKHLSIAITGDTSSWVTGSRKTGFFDLKGSLEILFSDLGISGVCFKYAKNKLYKPSASAVIEIEGKITGIIGEIDRKICGNFDIKENVCYCELNLVPVYSGAHLEKRFLELPKYPSVYRDISIIASKDTLNGDIISSITESGGPILKAIELIDRYVGKQVPDGKVSLTYRLEYRDPKKTLEEKEVSDVHSRILGMLENKFGARLRQ